MELEIAPFLYGGNLLKFIQYRSKHLDRKKLLHQRRDYALSLFNYKEKVIDPFQFKDHLNLRLVTDASIDVVGQEAFEGCLDLVRFDAAVKSIGKEAFSYCISLTDFNWLPLQSLAESSFSDSGLQKAYFPEAIEVIPKSCFEGCCKLSKLFLNKVRRIENLAFSMTDISVLSLPISLEHIAPWAFGNCFRLANIICERPEPPKIYATTFANDPIQNIWFFSEEVKNKYLQNPQWKKYEGKMRVTTSKELKEFLEIEAKKTWGML